MPVRPGSEELLDAQHECISPVRTPMLLLLIILFRVVQRPLLVSVISQCYAKCTRAAEGPKIVTVSKA
jgi:hypothetical protein